MGHVGIARLVLADRVALRQTKDLGDVVRVDEVGYEDSLGSGPIEPLRGRRHG